MRGPFNKQTSFDKSFESWVMNHGERNMGYRRIFLLAARPHSSNTFGSSESFLGLFVDGPLRTDIGEDIARFGPPKTPSMLGDVGDARHALIDRRPSDFRRSGTGPQLGKSAQVDSANGGERERQVSDSRNVGERPRTDTDVP
jgi:hypothetical protein